MRTTVLHGLLVGLWAGLAHADCYAHDGVLARNSAAFREDFEMVSCGNGTNNCCFQGDKCGSNLLCMNSEGTPTRQYCALSSWEGCSSMCADYPSTGTLLVDCGKNMYCCGAVDSSCCENDDEHYFVDPETGEVKHPSKATGASAKASPTWWTVDSKALLAATSMSSASSSATAISTTESSTPSTASTVSTTTSTPSNTSSPAPEEEKSSGLSAGAGAGIGIGAAAGVALVGGLAWWLLKRKKQQNAYEAPAAQHVEGGPVVYNGGAYASEAKPNGSYYAHQGPQTNQVHNSFPPQELDGTAAAQEMPGNPSRAMMK